MTMFETGEEDDYVDWGDDEEYEGQFENEDVDIED